VDRAADDSTFRALDFETEGKGNERMDPTSQDIHVLIVDNSPIFVNGLVATLKDEPGLSIVGTAIDQAALEGGLGETSPDVILLDVLLPVADLPSLIESIHRRGARVILLAPSESMVESLPTWLLRAGSDGYLLKNCDRAEFVQAIRSVHRGESYLTPIVAGHVVEQVRLHGESQRRRLARTTGLTERELRVLGLIASGRSNREVAELLDLSERTVENHARKIYRKLRVHDRTQATLAALQKGYLRLPTEHEAKGLTPLE